MDNITNIIPVSGDPASTAALIQVAQTLVDDSWRAVFVETGNEVKGTHEYLAYLEKRFCVDIEVIKPAIPIPLIERRRRFIERRWPTLLARGRDGGWEMTLGLSGYLKALAFAAIKETAQAAGKEGVALAAYLQERCSLDPDHLEMSSQEQDRYLRHVAAAGVSPFPPQTQRETPASGYIDGWMWCPARASVSDRAARCKVSTAIEALSVPSLSGTPFLDACLIRGKFPSCHNPFCAQMRDMALLEQVVRPLLDSGSHVRLWHSARTVPEDLRGHLNIELCFPLEGWSEEQIQRLHTQYHVDLAPIEVGRCHGCIYDNDHRTSTLHSLWEAAVSMVSERDSEPFVRPRLPDDAPEWARFPFGLPLFGSCSP